MAKFAVIAQKDAPKPTKQSGRLKKRMVEYDAYVQQVGAGKAGCLVPDDGETVRGVALRVARAGKRLGRDVETWVADGKVYFSTK
jgi:hypothetical protein